MAEITPINTRRDGMAVTGKQASDAVHCLQIPMYEESILLPNAAVAEVVGYLEPEPQPGAPDWYLGKITWREHKVPLVSFEVASGGQDPGALDGARVAVLNTLQGNPRLPYIAIVTQGLPSLKLAREEQVTPDSRDLGDRQSIAGFVQLDGVSLVVPDIDDLESRIQRLQVV
ncbi:chemotaxis protein CheW [Thiohalophilus thiocyanatoxydans]|uniref:Chemosensory pili system protein ChpC n=1 Tax=Thiohalophilus thiocyanatoxydans TaxID=381308 RepID=A0A4R8J1I7_9GAMM|nr:chemotaxis protein CheW [Thiohalophilus thiocyanatoxydans]TDY04177.1 chemosensory pili system protein ChpC [Thiohalophilus thiocyanatoxydans]